MVWSAERRGITTVKTAHNLLKNIEEKVRNQGPSSAHIIGGYALEVLVDC